MGVGTIGIVMFAAILLLTLLITYFSARVVSGVSDFLSAGGKISGPFNGLAISGDFLSATTLLGITGLFFSTGFDAALYLICPMIGMLIMMMLLAGPIRRYGRYTLADILATRFDERPMRILSATNTLVISIFYLTVQMVGAGALIETIFGLPYFMSVIVIGVLMTVYVSFGGMVATTWVQIVKAGLLIIGIAALSFLSLAHVGFDYSDLMARAATNAGAGFFGPGGVSTNFFSSLSLCVGLILGMCGLPHVLIRLFTVPDERSARQSIVVAMSIIAIVFLAILLLIGPAAVAFLKGNAVILDETGQVIGGGNMIVLHLARLVGGDILLGFISAVVFATILAVVAGLTIASVGALAHDLAGQVFRKNAPAFTTSTDEVGAEAAPFDELKASRVAGLIVGAIAVLLGIAFEGQNLAYLVGLVFAIAASANFPILMMALYAKRATTLSVICVGATGLAVSLVLVVASPSVWVDVLGFSDALIDIRYPALISVAASGLVALGFLTSGSGPTSHLPAQGVVSPTDASR